jgi:uncharacterized protein YecE (DUF72 family)
VSVAVGTSGFEYRHWRGPFYPPGLAAREHLDFYAGRFQTVELNSTFYRMPSADAFRGWAAAVPEGFVFAVKASRYLTHIRRLNEPDEPVAFLMDRAKLLGEHLGPILLQLPPNLSIELERLDRTLGAFERAGRPKVAVELRNSSWFTPAVERLLIDHGAALCLTDRKGPGEAAWRTAGWFYVRFHEGRGSPPGCYRDEELADWAARLRGMWPAAADGYAYFNNDGFACAIADAERLSGLLGHAGAGTGTAR